MIDVLFVDKQVISVATVPDSQCYDCDEFGHFALDCPNKILPSGTPLHHARSHSRYQYTHTWRDRLCYTYYGSNMGVISAGLQSNHHSHCNRSSSFRRHTSHSSSSCHSSLCHILANGCPHHQLCHDTDRHSCTPMPHLLLLPQTSLMPLHRPDAVSFQQLPLYCTGISAKKSQVTPKTFNPIKPMVSRLSLSRILLQILHQIQTGNSDFFKLLEPSSRREEDEWRGYSSNNYHMWQATGHRYFIWYRYTEEIISVLYLGLR